MSKLTIKLVRSLVGSSDTQRKTIEALGLKKIGQSVTLADTPATRGALNKVRHLLAVEEA